MPNIIMRAMHSSQIHSSGYDAESRTLRVCFWARKKGEEPSPGSVYEYYRVPQAVVDTLRKADEQHEEMSVGRTFGQLIKAHPDLYPYRKLSAEEVAEMRREVADVVKGSLPKAVKYTEGT